MPLYTVWYNGVRINKAVKMKREMAAQVLQTLSSMENIVAATDAAVAGSQGARALNERDVSRAAG